MALSASGADIAARYAAHPLRSASANTANSGSSKKTAKKVSATPITSHLMAPGSRAAGFDVKRAERFHGAVDDAVLMRAPYRLNASSTPAAR